MRYCYLGNNPCRDTVSMTCDRPVGNVTDELGLKFTSYCLRGLESTMR